MYRNTRSIFSLAAAATAALALFTAPQLANAQNRYKITDLGTVPGTAYSWTWQQVINEQGVVAAYSNNILNPNAFATDVSFLWYDGRTLLLPGLPGAVDTIAFGLNNCGQVVGRSTPAAESSRAVLWDSGVIHQLNELPGDDKSGALLINDAGRAVGYSEYTVTGVRRAVTWYKGIVNQLPPLPGGGGYDEALGINSEGKAIGWSGTEAGYGVSEHIALWDRQGVHDLGQLGGGWGDGYSINNKDQATGISGNVLGLPDAFLWDNGNLVDLGALPGDVGSVGLDINDKGQIVGQSNITSPDFNGTRAFLWENGQMTDLQTKIPAGSGWTLLAAGGDQQPRGQIVGIGIHNGLYRDYVMTPDHADHDHNRH